MTLLSSVLSNPVVSRMLLNALPQGGSPQGNSLQGDPSQDDPSQDDVLQSPEVEALSESMNETPGNLPQGDLSLSEPPSSDASSDGIPLPPVSMDSESDGKESASELSFDELEASASDTSPDDTSSDHAGLTQEESEELHAKSQEHALWNSFSMALARASKDVGKYLTSREVITAVPHGMANAGIEAVELLASMGEGMNEQLGKFVPGYQQLLDVIPDSHINLPNFQAPKTTTGKLVSGTAQFIGPAAWVSRGLGMWNFAVFLAKRAPMARAMLVGAITDVVAFDPYEARLSNILAECGPEVAKPLFEFFKSDKDEPEVWARVKNAVEGGTFGLVGEGILGFLKNMKKVLKQRETNNTLVGENLIHDEIIEEKAQNLLYWLHHKAVNDELLSHDQVPQSALAPEIAESIKHSDKALEVSRQEFLDIVQSDNWRNLPEAVREQYDNLLKGYLDPDTLLASEKIIIEKDKITRQEQVDARVNDFLGLDTPVTADLKTPGRVIDIDKIGAQLAARRAAGVETSDADLHHLLGRGINFDSISTDADTLKIMKDLQTLCIPQINAQRGGARTHEEIKKLADTLDVTADVMEGNLQKLVGFTQDLDAKVYLANTYLNAMFARLKEMAIKADRGDLGEAGMIEFMRLTEIAKGTTAQFLGMKAEIARGMNALKIKITPTAGHPVTSHLDAETLGVETLRNQRMIAKLIATAENPRAMAKIVKKTTGWEKGRNIAQEGFINFILSGPKTHVVNITSSAMSTVWHPMERIMGGLVKMNTEQIVEGSLLARNVMEGLFDVVKLTSKGGRLHLDDVSISPTSPYKDAVNSFVKNEPYSLGSSPFDEVRPYSLSAEKLDLRPSTTSVLGALKDEDYSEALRGMMIHSVDWTGKAVNLPSRMLTTEDAFFKSLNAQAYQRMEMQKLLKAGATEAEIAAKTPLIDRKAMAYAEKVTFTSPLPPGSYSRSISNFVNEHPELRFILPFIRTPANLIKFWHHRTPGLNLLSKDFRNRLFHEDKEIQSEALGQLSTGWILTAVAVDLAAQGKLVGEIPKEMREVAAAKGMLPYSHVETDERGRKQYTQLSRTDPIGMTFCVAADLAAFKTVLRTHSDASLMEEVGEAFAAVSMALAHNLNSRSYLVGVTNLLEAMGSPEHKMQRFAGSMIKGFIPNFLQQLRREEDPYQRSVDPRIFKEAGNLMDFIKEKIPGLSQSLSPVLDFLGREVHNNKTPGGLLGPIAVSEDKHSVVLDELLRLKLPVHRPAFEIGGVHLTPEQHHDYSVLAAQPLGLPSLEEALEELIESPFYEELTEGSENVEGTKQRAIRKIISRYRRIGQALFLGNNPEVDAEIQRRKSLKYSSEGVLPAGE